MKICLKYIFIIAGLVLVNCSLSKALDNEVLIAKANGLYIEGEYTAASELYEKVLADGKEASELYYNLGNTYFKLGNIPAGILNYERAKKIKPNDDDINFNLKLANLKTVDKIEAIPNFIIGDLGNEIKDRFSHDVWGWLCVISIWIASVLFFIYIELSLRGLKKIFFILSMTALIFSIIAFAFGYSKYISSYKQIEAIVFSPTVTIKSSPDEQGKDLFVLHEGTKVFVLDEMGDWYKIKLASGSIGWIPTPSIEQI